MSKHNASQFTLGLFGSTALTSSDLGLALPMHPCS